MKAVIFLAHGSRRQEANRAFLQLAGKVALALDLQIFEVAFIESSSRSFQEAMESCIDRGASAILIYPHFLFSGTHLHRDLASEIETARNNHPQIEISISLPLGEHPKLSDLVTSIIAEELQN